MTTSISSEAQENHEWTNGQSKLKNRCSNVMKQTTKVNYCVALLLKTILADKGIAAPTASNSTIKLFYFNNQQPQALVFIIKHFNLVKWTLFSSEY